MVEAKLEEVDRLHRKMSRFELRQNRGRRDDPENEWREPCPFMHNRQKKRKAALTLTDKINIAYKVLIEHDKMLDVAKEFRITKTGGSHIVSKFQKNKAAFDEML